MAATATATEAPKKTRKPPKLFTVSGDSTKITTALTAAAVSKLDDAVHVLKALALAGETFPMARFLGHEIDKFIFEPTKKPNQETPK